MPKLRLVALIVLVSWTTGCAATQRAEQVSTEQFIDNTLRQYGIGPNGRAGQPDAVVTATSGDLAV